MIKPAETSKPKMSKEFIESLKNIPQIPQRPKQVPVPSSNSQLPSPITISNKNKKQEEIRQFPIEKICLDKPKQTFKHLVSNNQSLRQRKENVNDRDYERKHPQNLKPTRKQQSSLVKKARDQRLSRSMIDMSIYDLLDQTTDKKSKRYANNQNILNDVAYYKQYPNEKVVSKPNTQVQKKKQPLAKTKVSTKDNGIKVINNLNKKDLKHQKINNHQDVRRPEKRDGDIYNFQGGYRQEHYLRSQYPQYHNLDHHQNRRDNRNNYSNFYDSYSNYGDERLYRGRLGSIGGYGQLTGLRGYSGYNQHISLGGYGYRNSMRYY